MSELPKKKCILCNESVIGGAKFCRTHRNEYARDRVNNGDEYDFASCILADCGCHTRQKRKRKRDIEDASVTPIDLLAFRDVQQNRCVYCNVELIWKINGGWKKASLERISNDGGYHLGNVVLACSACNAARNKYFLRDFRHFCDELSRTLFVDGEVGAAPDTADEKFRVSRILSGCATRAKRTSTARTADNNYLRSLLAAQEYSCAITGIRFEWKRHHPLMASIDKLVVGRDGPGYADGNVQWVLQTVNYGRSTRSVEEACWWLSHLRAANLGNSLFTKMDLDEADRPWKKRDAQFKQLRVPGRLEPRRFKILAADGTHVYPPERGKRGWCFQLDDRTDGGGKRKHITRSFKTKEEARAYEKQMIDKYNQDLALRRARRYAERCNAVYEALSITFPSRFPSLS